jgi:hypothetical protein
MVTKITDQQPIGYNIPQAVLHSLMPPKMGKIVARNTSSYIGLINKEEVIVTSSWLSSLPSLLMMHGQTNINFSANLVLSGCALNSSNWVQT